MFQHQGPWRTDRQNRIVAGCLAFVGGFVNSAGYVLIGSFTSHVTGNVGRLANDLAYRQYEGAATTLPLVAAFFGGAFLASMAIESDVFGRTANAYAVALLGESTLLLLFTIISRLTVVSHPHVRDAEAALLCGATGMQNSLVTRLSGAVVRTTHPDRRRHRPRHRGGTLVPLVAGLAVGAGGFEALTRTEPAGETLPALAGALVVVRLRLATMLLPTVAILACAAYASLGGRRVASSEGPPGVPNSRR